MIEHFVEEFIPLARLGHNIDDAKRLFNEPICLDTSLQFGGKNRSEIEIFAMGTLLYGILE